MHYLYGSKKAGPLRLVATFGSEQQLLAYVRWATLKSEGEHHGKFEQGSCARHERRLGELGPSAHGGRCRGGGSQSDAEYVVTCGREVSRRGLHANLVQRPRRRR